MNYENKLKEQFGRHARLVKREEPFPSNDLMAVPFEGGFVREFSPSKINGHFIVEYYFPSFVADAQAKLAALRVEIIAQISACPEFLMDMSDDWEDVQKMPQVTIFDGDCTVEQTVIGFDGENLILGDYEYVSKTTHRLSAFSTDELLQILECFTDFVVGWTAEKKGVPMLDEIADQIAEGVSAGTRWELSIVQDKDWYVMGEQDMRRISDSVRSGFMQGTVMYQSTFIANWTLKING